MGKIQVIAIHVEGDSSSIDQALKICAEAIGGLGNATAKILSGAQALPDRANGGEKKWYECPICGRKFADSRGLGGHANAHRGGSNEPRRGAKLYFCPAKNCAQSFTSSGRRDRHMMKRHDLKAPVDAA